MSLFRTEKEFEDQIYEYIVAHKENLINGRPVVGVCRQVDLGSYGIADLITIEKHGETDIVNVIELKNIPFNPGMVFQIGRYVSAVKLGINYELLRSSYVNFELLGETVKLHESAKVIGSLVCTDFVDIDDSVSDVFSMLGVSVYSAEFHLLSVLFQRQIDDSNYRTDQIKKIQSSLSALFDAMPDHDF